LLFNVLGVAPGLQCMRAGLDHYLPGELPPDQLATRLREIIASRKRPLTKERSNGSPPSVLGAEDSAESTLVGQSPAIREVLNIIRLVAPTRSTVLITGPSGTGKELAARLIHSLSPRAGLPMVTVNCGAIPENLLESEFFGHVKGAFTGAIAARAGRFEQAQASTLFLDEIGDMPIELQPKVLRALQEREFQRVGSSQTMQVDVRVIAATNCDLLAKVRRGEFREDLYYRLKVVPLRMPSLAERLVDVPLLVEHLLGKLCRREDLPLKTVPPETLEALAQYCWPGNVRQLENAIEEAVVLSGSRRQLEPGDFPLPIEEGQSLGMGQPGEVQLPPGGMDLDAFLGALERGLLEQALRQSGGNKKRAADMLRLKRTTLSAKLRAAGVQFSA